MSKRKLNNKTKITLIIGVIFCVVALILGGKYIMRQKAEDYILREARVGLKIYFEKYYNNVDPNSIKLRIEYMQGMTNEPIIEGYVNGDKNLNFSCDVTRLPESEWKTPQDKLGMVIAMSGMSWKLTDKRKYEYSYHSSYSKTMKRPSELIPESEVEKAEKDRDLLNYIPEMDSF